MSSSYEKEKCLEFFSLHPMLAIKEFFDLTVIFQTMI